MRRISVLFVIALAAIGLAAVPAAAMQPPAAPAQEHFGCFEGDDDAVRGHPGAAGVVDAAGRVKALTGDPTPTAWNAVEHAEPITLGSC